jgi:DNA-binding NtrC family response regulator
VYNKELNTNIQNLSSQALELLAYYPWPGNVRDLQNCIQSAMILAREGTLTTEHLPMRIKGYHVYEPEVTMADAGLDKNIKYINARLEKELIIDALSKTNYSRTETAKLLKISRKTLFNKMKEYDL